MWLCSQTKKNIVKRLKGKVFRVVITATQSYYSNTVEMTISANSSACGCAYSVENTTKIVARITKREISFRREKQNLAPIALLYCLVLLF